MCAVVTVGAVVGPTCGACAARARRWSTAYRRVPKRCAPKSWGLLCTKIINRGIFACFAPRKQVRVCKFHSFGCVFCFLLYTRAQKRASPTALAGGMAPQVDEHGGRSGGGARVGGSSGKPTVSGEATRRYFTLGHTAARDARRVPASSSPRTVTGGARLSSPTAFFVHYLQKNRYFTH